MKKIISLCLTIIIVLSCFVACDNNNSNSNSNNNSSSASNAKEISIAVLESAFKRSHSKFNFTKTETSNGFSFKYVDSTFSITYSGTADKKENITSVTIVYDGVSPEIISSRSKMNNIFNRVLNDAYSLTFGETKAANCYGDLIVIYGVLGKGDASEAELLDIICDGKTAKVEGWAVSSKLVDKTFTITMEK